MMEEVGDGSDPILDIGLDLSARARGPSRSNAKRSQSFSTGSAIFCCNRTCLNSQPGCFKLQKTAQQFVKIQFATFNCGATFPAPRMSASELK